MIQVRHQRKHAHGKENRRRERADEAQTMEQSEDEIGGDDGPREKRRRLVEIVDRAMRDGKAALDHGDGVQGERGEQQKIIRVVVPAKTHPPQENRIHRACAVKRNR